MLGKYDVFFEFPDERVHVAKVTAKDYHHAHTLGRALAKQNDVDTTRVSIHKDYVESRRMKYGSNY